MDIESARIWEYYSEGGLMTSVSLFPHGRSGSAVDYKEAVVAWAELSDGRADTVAGTLDAYNWLRFGSIRLGGSKVADVFVSILMGRDWAGSAIPVFKVLELLWRQGENFGW